MTRKFPKLPQASSVSERSLQRFGAWCERLPDGLLRFAMDSLSGFGSRELARIWLATEGMVEPREIVGVIRAKRLELSPISPDPYEFAEEGLRSILAAAFLAHKKGQVQVDSLSLGRANTRVKSCPWMREPVHHILKTSAGRWAVLYRMESNLPPENPEVVPMHIVGAAAYVAARCKAKEVGIDGVMVVHVKVTGGLAMAEWVGDAEMLSVFRRRVLQSMKSNDPYCTFSQTCISASDLPVDEVIAAGNQAWNKVLAPPSTKIEIDFRRQPTERDVKEQQKQATRLGALRALKSAVEKEEKLCTDHLKAFDALGLPNAEGALIKKTLRGIDATKLADLVSDIELAPEEYLKEIWDDRALVRLAAAKNIDIPEDISSVDLARFLVSKGAGNDYKTAYQRSLMHLRKLSDEPDKEKLQRVLTVEQMKSIEQVITSVVAFERPMIAGRWVSKSLREGVERTASDALAGYLNSVHPEALPDHPDPQPVKSAKRQKGLVT